MDIRTAVEKRVETRIAAARRFAVRVRNHAKMVDCYLNTYNNHRSFFSDKKKITTDIIEHPQVQKKLVLQLIFTINIDARKAKRKAKIVSRNS